MSTFFGTASPPTSYGGYGGAHSAITSVDQQERLIAMARLLLRPLTWPNAVAGNAIEDAKCGLSLWETSTAVQNSYACVYIAPSIDLIANSYARRYFFEYPTGWKTDVINKVQKGTQVSVQQTNRKPQDVETPGAGSLMAALVLPAGD